MDVFRSGKWIEKRHSSTHLPQMANSIDTILELERRRRQQEDLLLASTRTLDTISSVAEATRLYEESSSSKLIKAAMAQQDAYNRLFQSPVYSAVEEAMRGYRERAEMMSSVVNQTMERLQIPEMNAITEAARGLQESYEAMIAPSLRWQKQNSEAFSAIAQTAQGVADQLAKTMEPWSAVTEAMRQNQAAIIGGFAQMDRSTIEAYARAIYDEDELASLPEDQRELALGIFERLMLNTKDEFRKMGLVHLVLILITVWTFSQGPDYTDEDRSRDESTHAMIEAISLVMNTEAEKITAAEELPRGVVKASWANVRTEPHGSASLKWRLGQNEGVFVQAIEGRWVKVFYRNGTLDTLETGWIWRDSLIIGGGREEDE